MPQTGSCTDVTCNKELTELYECHCCNWLICLKHLLEHVEISKRDKKQQLDNLRNQLISISYTLELIVEKKIHEIEIEKELINQAKIMLDKSEYTIEEIQLITEEINQAIVSNRKEETIVKVESSLFDIKPSLCSTEISNEMTRDISDMSNLSSSSNNILQQTKSPIYRSLRIHPNRSQGSTTPNSNDHSTKVVNGSNINSINDENIDSTKDEADDEEHDQENIMNPKNLCNRCPLTFDGTFGLTKAKHSLQFCPSDNCFRRNLVGHFVQKHHIKTAHARRLYQAIKCGQNSKTTKLFRDNEDVVDHHPTIPCPFTSSMINLIGCCPTQSRKIPCPSKSIPHLSLALHLKQYHNISPATAQKISKSYKEKLSKRIHPNVNDAPTGL